MKKTVYLPLRIESDLARLIDDYSRLMFGYVNRSRAVRLLLESFLFQDIEVE